MGGGGECLGGEQPIFFSFFLSRLSVSIVCLMKRWQTIAVAQLFECLVALKAKMKRLTFIRSVASLSSGVNPLSALAMTPFTMMQL